MSKALKPVASTPTLSVAHWPSQKKVQKLADRLDGLVPASRRMSAAAERLRQRPCSDALRLAKEAVDWYEGSGARRLVDSGVLVELQRECCPNPWWGDDGDVQRPEVAKMVAMLVGSWPTSNIPEPAVFVRALIEDVMALNPSFVVFESACRKLRRDLKFMPSIAEVVAEIESQSEAWEERLDALDYIDDNYQGLVGRIATSEVAVAAAEAAAEEQRERRRKYLEAKKAPLLVGDCVRWKGVGAVGVLIEHSASDFEDCWKVRFVYQDRDMDTKCLEKLVEGDDGFAPSLLADIEASRQSNEEADRQLNAMLFPSE
jgi:hypothetical protein